MAQQVKMPDGVTVAFPDDMPKEEIRALIEEKFPKEAASKAPTAPEVPRNDLNRLLFGGDRAPANPLELITGTGDQNGGAIGGLEAGGGLSPEEQASGDWQRGILWPIAKNNKTGERKLAVPGIVQGSYEGIKSAATLPGDVLSGKYNNDLGPGTSFKDASPELIGRGLDFTGATMGGSSLPKAAGAGAAGAGATLKLADEFGVPLTRGQTSGDIGQLTKEEILRQTEGTGRNIIRGFDETQKSAIEAAAGKVGPAGDADNMAEIVQGGLRDKVAFSKQRTASLYKIAEDGGAVIDGDAVRALPDFVKQQVNDGNIIIDGQLTPAADRAMKEIEDAGNLSGALTPRVPDGVPEGENIGVMLKGLEQVRKRIVNLSGANDTDRRALAAVKRAYDAWLDDAADQGFMSGDDNALAAYKAARMETQVYKGLTAPKAGDQATLRIKKMQEADATAEEVANWLYGANVSNPSLSAPKVAAKLKTTFGAESKEFQAIRAGAWMRIIKDLRTGDMLSATKVSNRIDDFLNAKGETLSGVLFTPEEREKMQAFSTLLKKTITPREATNPSRTAFTLKSMFAAGMQAAAGALGLSTGGAPGAFAALIAVPVLRGFAGYRGATKAITRAMPKSFNGAALTIDSAARGAALAPSAPASKAADTINMGA